jgi:hypothetical protein
VPIFSSAAILDALQELGGKGSRRRIRTSLRQKGYDIPNDEFNFHFDQLLRSGRIRPMIGEPSKLEDVYEVTTVPKTSFLTQTELKKTEVPRISADTQCPKCGAKVGAEHNEGCPDEVLT